MEGSDTMNLMLDPNGSGEVTSEEPEPHWLLRLFGIQTKTVTTNIIATDYQNYIIWVKNTFNILKMHSRCILLKNILKKCTCNDDSFWRSYDEVSIAVRNKDPNAAQTIVSQILLSAVESGQLTANQAKKFQEVDQGEECNVLQF